MLDNILFKITERDIRDELERSEMNLSEESVQEILKDVSEMSVEDIVVDILTEYSAHKIREAMKDCLECPELSKCPGGQATVLGTMKALGMKSMIVSGRN